MEVVYGACDAVLDNGRILDILDAALPALMILSIDIAQQRCPDGIRR